MTKASRKSATKPGKLRRTRKAAAIKAPALSSKAAPLSGEPAAPASKRAAKASIAVCG